MISEFIVSAANGNERPNVNSNLVSVQADAGSNASMNGTYQDPDGDAVTLSSSVGAVINNGGGGPIKTWTWNYVTKGGAADPKFVYVTGADTGLRKGQAAFNLTVNSAKPLAQDVLDDAIALLPGLPPKDAKKLQEAIDKLQEALNPAFWIDAQPRHRQGREQGLRPHEGRGQQAGRVDQEQLDPGLRSSKNDR
jgi:hypothetical protein